MGYRIAGRSFVAKCGHKIEKGERYLVIDDYFAYVKYHTSKCESCADGKKVEA